MYSMDKHPDGTNTEEKNNVHCYRVKVHSRQFHVQGVETVVHVVKYSESDKHRHSKENIQCTSMGVDMHTMTIHRALYVGDTYVHCSTGQ